LMSRIITAGTCKTTLNYMAFSLWLAKCPLFTLKSEQIIETRGRINLFLAKYEELKCIPI